MYLLYTKNSKRLPYFSLNLPKIHVFSFGSFPLEIDSPLLGFTQSSGLNSFVTVLFSPKSPLSQVPAKSLTACAHLVAWIVAGVH